MIKVKTKRRVVGHLVPLLLLVALCLSGPGGYAQDKNLLARVAYEEAEKAFEAGKLSTSYEELKKVDEYLGKVTPKAQFLRVQIWKTWAEEDGQYLQSAIWTTKTYLAMDKTFDLPEEKKLEVTRWLVRMEKDKVAYDKAQVAADKANKEEAIRKAKANAFVDSLYKVFQYKVGMTEEELVSRYQQELKKLKRKAYSSSNVFYKKGATSEVGLDEVNIYNNKVIEFEYVVKYHETDPKGVKAYMDGLMTHIKSLFLAKDLYISDDHEAMSITTSNVIPRSKIRFQYFEHAKKKSVKSYVILYFMTSYY
ncbi:MAG TPA: hypothetical protein VGE66_13070 [Chitinophagaceae bacterium]